MAPFDLVCEFAPGAGPLDVIGGSYLSLDGTATADASTPDAAALDITGDIDIRCELYLDNWADPAGPIFVAKWDDAGDERSYLFGVGSGLLAILWTTDGTLGTLGQMFTTQPVPLISGRLAVRVTLDVDNGSSGRTATFYTAASIDGPWTQLGDADIDSGTTSIHAGTASLQVGNRSESGTGAPTTGRVYAAEVRDGIDGTVVADPDFSAEDAGTTSFSDDAGNTWTLGGTAEIVGFTWVDISEHLLEAAWSYGRDDELDHHPPGECTLRLKNDERQFDPDHASGDWFGELLPRVPVRLRSVWSRLRLPSAAGAHATTPDDTSFAYTDLDVRLHLAMDDWTPGGFGQTLAGQWATSQEGWQLSVNTSGNLVFTFTTDGTTDLSRTSTVATGFVDGTDHWVRATLDADNDAAGHDVDFYTSTDGVTWTQLGTTVTTAGTVTPHNSTANLTVGSPVTFLDPAADVRYMEVRTTIDGTVTANPDFMSVDPGATTFTDGCGNTWTVNGTATVSIDTGHLLDEFYGFVGDDGFAQELHPPAAADCVLGLVDLLAVLAGGYKLPDVFDQAVLAREPVAYWVLDSPTGSEQIGDLSGNGHDGTVVGDVQFSRAPIAAGHTPAAFFDGDNDRIDISRSPLVSDVTAASVVATFTAQSAATLNMRVLYIQSDGNVPATEQSLYVNTSGHLIYARFLAAGGLDFDAGAVVDGEGHIVFGTGDGIALDGATLVTTNPVGVQPTANGVGIGGFAGIAGLDHWHGRIGAVAVYDRNLSDADRQLILDGYGKLTGDRTDEHISWALDRIGVPTELRNLDEGTVLMGPAATGGRDALEWIREVVATEQGEWYVDHRDGGKLRFVNRYSRFLDDRSTAAQETFSDDSSETNVVRVERDDLELVPSNATDIVNQATVTWRDGSEIVDDTASQASFGPRPRQVDTQATTATQAKSAGEWLVARYAQPKSKVRGVGADASAARIGFRAVRHLRIGDRVTNRIHPQAVGVASTHSLFIEKAAHAVERGVSWHTAWRTSAVDTFTPWIWGTGAWNETTYWG